MTHSDDDGLVLPPKLAPAHVVDHSDLPFRRRHARACSSTATTWRASCARSATPTGRSASMVDERDERGGDKVWDWIKKGVPLRLEIGPRDIEKDALFVGRRDRAPKDKQSVAARGVRRDRRRDAAIDPGRRCSQRAKDLSRAAHAPHRLQGRVLRVLHRAARAGERADADPRRLRADALQRRRAARRADQERPAASPCAAFRSRRASRAPVRSPASPARSAWCGRRPIDRSGGAVRARTRAWLQIHFLRRAVGLHRHPRQADHASGAPLVWWRMTLVGGALARRPDASGAVCARLPARLIAIYAGIGVLVALHWLTFYGSIKLSNASVARDVHGADVGVHRVHRAAPRAAQVRSARADLRPRGHSRRRCWSIGGTPTGMRLGIAVGVLSALILCVFGALNKRYIGKADAMSVTGVEMGAGALFLTLRRAAAACGRSVVRNAVTARRVAAPGARDGLHAAAVRAGLVAMRQLSAFSTALAVNLEPVYAIVLAILLLGEQRELAWPFYVGVAIILASCCCTRRSWTPDSTARPGPGAAWITAVVSTMQRWIVIASEQPGSSAFRSRHCESMSVEAC